MLRALWFLIKLGVLAAIFVWVADRPGEILLEWRDYSVTMHLGLALAALLGVLLIALFIYRIIRAVADIPGRIRTSRQIKRRDNGYRILTQGMSAIAAGDTGKASRKARKAARLLNDKTGLPLFIEAQAARLDGREQEAAEQFSRLVQNKDTAFLGIRGLLTEDLAKGAPGKALVTARKALEKEPKQPWILKIVYTLEIEERNFDAARRTLKRAVKAGAIDESRAKNDEIAMIHVAAEEAQKQMRITEAERLLKEAYNKDKSFIPSAERLARFYLENGKRRSAASLIEKAWKTGPHPDLAALWTLARPKSYFENAAKTLEWQKRLIKKDPDSIEGYLAYAHAAMAFKLWGEARDMLESQSAQHHDVRLYRLMADLEERAGAGADKINHWLQKLPGAPPEKTWLCLQTGRSYHRWAPIAEPHGAFNSIVWDDPGARPVAHDYLYGPSPHAGLIETL